MPQAMQWIDLDRHPIDALDAPPGRALVDRCREQLRASGACELEGFLRPEAAMRLAAETEERAALAHRHRGRSTPYLEIPDDHWPEGHPRRRWDAYSLAALAFDHIPEALRALYAWEPLMEFVRRAQGLAEIHRYADPLGACSVNVFEPGDRQNWHFDQTDFVVSLALQRPDAGGEFHTTRRLRRPGEECYEQVAAILDGAREGVTTLPMRPGSLVLFEGRSCLHRVSRVEGRRRRLVALLSYDAKPGTCATPLLQQARYGRVQQPGEAR
jgi:hypothetical protein